MGGAGLYTTGVGLGTMAGFEVRVGDSIIVFVGSGQVSGATDEKALGANLDQAGGGVDFGD